MYIEKEMYFGELAHTIVEASRSTICTVDHQPETGDAAVQVQRPSADTSLFGGFFKIPAVLMDVKGYLIVLLISISLTTNDASIFPGAYWLICISPLKKISDPLVIF